MRLRRRWTRRTIRTLALSVACGLAAYLMLAADHRAYASLRERVGDPVPVVLAARDLARGTVLAAGDLTVASVPRAFAPPGAADAVDAAVGHALVVDIAAGEAVTATRIGTQAGPIAVQVPPGLRAFVVTVPIPPDALLPGDRVDVIGSFGGQHPYSDTVASALEVLAVLDPPTGALDPTPSLVLLVSGSTAERLAYATSFGSLTVSVIGAA